MLLSNREMHQALDEGRLKITPEPLPRTAQGSQKSPYDSHTVNLLLHDSIAIPIGGKYVCDPSDAGNQADFQRRNSKQITITEDQPYLLDRNVFILATTREEISLPIPDVGDRCLGARVEGRSSLARLGLLVHFTAPTIHPGFNGRITFELINLGPAPILLRVGMAIAQLIVEEVRGIPFWTPSQFHGQSAPEGVIRKK
ncbi:MAG: dCTP deaminase [Planctomycetaceae bacterium]|nr:dCTP deaminase [Planctomycetaceae bacterium]